MEDDGQYEKFLRMTPEIFDDLLNLIECDIKKKNTIMRDPIPPSIKLATTLSSSRQELFMLNCNIFWIQQSTVCKFIPEVCGAIYTRLKDTYLKVTSFISIK